MKVVENEKILLIRDLLKEWIVRFKVNLNELLIVCKF